MAQPNTNAITTTAAMIVIALLATGVGSGSGTTSTTSSAAGSGAGTATDCRHLGHLMRLPASSVLARSFFPQASHANDTFGAVSTAVSCSGTDKDIVATLCL